MTFKSLMNLGGFGKQPFTPIDRYHSGSGGYHHGHRGGHKGGKGGGSGAALSALTLLAFLFLINVMQQSLQDNNSTSTTMTTAVLLRDDELPIILDTKEGKEEKEGKEAAKADGSDRLQTSYGTPPTKSQTKGYVRLNN